jgi:hypothetical protein
LVHNSQRLRGQKQSKSKLVIYGCIHLNHTYIYRKIRRSEFSDRINDLWTHLNPEYAINAFKAAGIISLNPLAYSDNEIAASNTFPWDEQNIQSLAEEVLAENSVSNPADEFLFHKLLEKSTKSQQNNDSSSSIPISKYKMSS